jgi:hypothetical protein
MFSGLFPSLNTKGPRYAIKLRKDCQPAFLESVKGRKPLFFIVKMLSFILFHS